MKIQVNGENRQIGQGMTIAAVLEGEGYFSQSGKRAHRIVVALNETIVAPQLYGQQEVSDGDRLEVMGAITGG